MREHINEPVAVAMLNRKGKEAWPQVFYWANTYHKIKSVGYHHRLWEGNSLQHVFSVVSENDWAFRLKFDSNSLIWILEEVSDGSAGQY